MKWLFFVMLILFFPAAGLSQDILVDQINLQPMLNKNQECFSEDAVFNAINAGEIVEVGLSMEENISRLSDFEFEVCYDYLYDNEMIYETVKLMFNEHIALLLVSERIVDVESMMPDNIKEMVEEAVEAEAEEIVIMPSFELDIVTDNPVAKVVLVVNSSIEILPAKELVIK